MDPCTDLANAKRFAAEHTDNVRYSGLEKCWYAWDGRRWRRDETGAASRLAKATAGRLLLAAATDLKRANDKENVLDIAAAQALLKWATKSQQAKGIEAMLSLARSELPLVVTPARFDADPWVLNCTNGTLDLRTGTLRPHRREDLLTALCPHPFDATATCPRWEQFLADIFPGEPGTELIGYMQRLLGYCLTGDTSNHVLPILWGGGANGKSTFVEAVLHVLGPDYTGKADPDLLVSSNRERHPTGLADLKGRRLVVAMETAEGRRLNETLVKELTGGDKLKARRMHENWWDFDPTHKLLMGTNHKPEVRSGGHGIWRRLHLIPFAVRFWSPDEGQTGPPALKQDRTLKEKLRAEAAGILAWMVRGCLAWLAADREFGMPKPVRAATDEYRTEEDTFARFLADRCETHPDGKVLAGDLYKAYLAWWAEQRESEKPYSTKKVGQKLREAGFTPGKSGVMAYSGVRLKGGAREDQGGSGGVSGSTSHASARGANPEMASNPPRPSPILPDPFGSAKA